MEKNPDHIYTHEIKPYKKKRLFYSSYFRDLYNGTVEPKISQLSYEYKIVTHCWLQRLNEQDIPVVMAWWYSKHRIAGNWYFLRKHIIPETYFLTRETIKAQRKAENERAKVRKLAKAGKHVGSAM